MFLFNRYSLFIGLFIATNLCGMEHISHAKILVSQKKINDAYNYIMHVLQKSSLPIEDRQQLGTYLFNFGNDCYKNEFFNQAVIIFDYLTHVYSKSSAIFYNLGYSLNELARYHEANQAYTKALELKPKAPDILFQRSMVLLTLGDYETGWQEYESRWQRPDKQHFALPCARWDGISSLQGKKIILLSEGALGDCLQFVRYAKLIKDLGAYVIVQALEPLKKLLTLCPYIDHVSISPGTVPKADFWISLLSLPMAFKTKLSTVPHTIPYLFADSLLVKYWQSILTDNYFKVGICWQADTHNDANRPMLARRSIPAHLFESLAHMPGIRLFSLQKNDCSPTFMYDFGPDLDTDHGRFMDTAAIISNLDLIISVDTSIAHLAGAMAKPVWLILPFKADWRWLHDCQYCPWYPTMQLYRKKQDENWQDVIEYIKRDLKAILNQ